MQQNITDEAMSYLMSLDYKSHKDKMSSENATRIRSLCRTPELIMTLWEQCVRYFICYAVMLIRIYYLSINIFILFIIFSTLFGIVIGFLVSDFIQSSCDRIREISNCNIGIMANYLDNILNIKLYRYSPDRIKEYSQNLRNASVYCNQIFYVLWTIIAFLITVTSLTATYMLYSYQIPNWKEIMSVIFAVMPLFFDVTYFVQVCMNFRAEVANGLKIFDEVPETTNNTHEFKDGSIIMQNVSMQYPKSDAYAIKNITFKIKSGQKVGIVGHSGSGKSTLFYLLMRVYQPTEGDISFGERNLKEVSEDVLMNELSVVLQNSTIIYDMSILENLTGSQTGLAECRAACKKVYLDEVFMRMKDQYNTIVTPDIPLSGGQLQRFGIARACIKRKANGEKPKLILMDECTSNQDYETERYMQNELFSTFDPEQTVIMIAHRLNTLKFCDLILVLQKGELVEQGSEKELLKLNGAYSKLYHSAKDGIIE